MKHLKRLFQKAADKLRLFVAVISQVATPEFINKAMWQNGVSDRIATRYFRMQFWLRSVLSNPTAEILLIASTATFMSHLTVFGTLTVQLYQNAKYAAAVGSSALLLLWMKMQSMIFNYLYLSIERDKPQIEQRRAMIDAIDVYFDEDHKIQFGKKPYSMNIEDAQLASV